MYKAVTIIFIKALDRQLQYLYIHRNDGPDLAVRHYLLSDAIRELQTGPGIYYAGDILENLDCTMMRMSNSAKDSLRSYVHNLYQTKFAPQREESNDDCQYAKLTSLCEPHSGLDPINEATELCDAYDSIDEDFDFEIFRCWWTRLLSSVFDDLPSGSFLPHNGEEPSSEVTVAAGTTNTNSDADTTNKDTGEKVLDEEKPDRPAEAFTFDQVGQVAGMKSGFSSRVLPSNYNSYGRYWMSK